MTRLCYFWPSRAPEDNAILRLPVTYRSQLVEVEIGQEKVEYALREGERLTFRHETEEIQLTRVNHHRTRTLMSSPLTN
jgi:alpha,alpha-trehalose phosphorylase